MKWLYVPFLLQGICMLVDEFCFHERRGLPRWEQLGHPLDSFITLSCFVSLLVFQVSAPVYIGLCGFSCLFITKDEFVHARECSGPEQWLHALLFILHPLIFYCAWELWQAQDYFVLWLQTMLITLFMFYQLFRWSLPWPKTIR